MGRTSRSSSNPPALFLPPALFEDADSSSWDDERGHLHHNSNLLPFFGDHWAVEGGELGPQLEVPIPLQSAWLGDISESCASLLRGLFEVRPGMRLGGRNFGALRSHVWFRDRGVSDWAALEGKKIPPAFRPGKRFVKDGFQPFDQCDERRLDETKLLFPTTPLAAESVCSGDGSLSDSAEFQQQFKSFHFIAPMHRANFSSFISSPCDTASTSSEGDSHSSGSVAVVSPPRELPPPHSGGRHPPLPLPNSHRRRSSHGNASPLRSLSSSGLGQGLAAEGICGSNLPPMVKSVSEKTPPRSDKLGFPSPFRWAMK